MSSDPPDLMERLLNESAKLRRAQFPTAELRMPGPMRARLHDEISAKARRPLRPSSGWRLSLWWPAFAAAMLILVCGAVFVSRHRWGGNGKGEHGVVPPTNVASRHNDDFGELAMNQSFLRTPNHDAAASARGSAVLSHFQVKRSGNRIEVVDADGSVYAGEIHAAGENGSGRGGKGDQSNADTTMSFHAVGANRTLNQPVIFEGQLIAAPAAGESRPEHSSATGAPASRISGSAKIGESLILRIEAAPLK